MLTRVAVDEDAKIEVSGAETRARRQQIEETYRIDSTSLTWRALDAFTAPTKKEA